MTDGTPEFSQQVTVSDSFSLRSRSYLSGHHLWSARHQARLCAELEAKLLQSGVSYHPEHRSYALASILSAVAFLESLVNEIFQDAYDKQVVEGGRLHGLTEPAVELMAQFWQATNNGRIISALDKYQMALLLVGKPRLDRGVVLSQDVKLLIDLRNALMHFKPATQEAAPPGRFEAALRSKFSPNPLMTGMGNPYFPDKCLGAACAEWACKAAKDLADEWSDRLGIWRYHELDLDTPRFSPPNNPSAS